MKTQYIVNTDTKKHLPWWLPFLLGGLLVVQFAGLCVWQISRGMDKLEQRDAFSASGSVISFQDGMEVRPYQPVSVTGRLLGGRQFLLENIIINSRYGYYVLTPVETGADEPLLLVNRGWIEKTGTTIDRPALAERIAVEDARQSLRGRVGSLPRAGMRMGDAIPAGSNWPQLAVYPTTADIEQALGRDIQPFVLLLDPSEELGFLRHWVPEEMGPGKHFGYALQWFAMGAVLAGLLIWNFRRRKSAHD